MLPSKQETANIGPITNLMVMLTNQCNLRCPFCFVDKNVKRMTYQTLYDTVQFLIRNAESCDRTPRLVFFGGEPMMEWDTLIIPITNYIRKEYAKPFELSITTNITLLSRERLEFMKDNEMYVLFSVDGGRDTMAINRPFANGKNPFGVVDRNIDDIVAIYPDAEARITLYQKTVGNLFDDIMYLVQKGFGQISLLPNLFDDWTEASISSFQRELQKYGDWIVDEFRAGRTPLIFKQYSEMFYKIMLRNRCVRDGEYQTMHRCHGCGKCGFGLGHHAACDTDGNIYGCLHIEHLSP